MQRLESFYLKNVLPYFKDNYSYVNLYEIPKVKKIIINRGFDDSCQNSKILELLIEELNIISCQYPTKTYARKSIASFKVKEGLSVGMFVTLRGKKMYSFLDRLISLSLPRIKDFQGLNPKSFDGFGNYNLGIKDQFMFPEVDFSKVSKVKGFNISIITNCKKDVEAFILLRELGMPFRN
jgi:large subunit ribosomal protein L5